MPKVRFPPERWVARRDEPEQGMWRYEGEWSTDLKRFVRFFTLISTSGSTCTALM
jgi:hypothetical protein